MKNLLALLVFGTSMAIALPQATAQNTSVPKKTVKAVKKKTAKKTSSKKTAAAAASSTAVAGEDDDERDPTDSDIVGSTTIDYACELGNKLTIYKNAGDDKFIALRWKNKLHRMKRIGTTTGANRFETRKHGLVWIGIPSKGMLLNSKKGQQLANECKDPQQLAQK